MLQESLIGTLDFQPEWKKHFDDSGVEEEMTSTGMFSKYLGV